MVGVINTSKIQNDPEDFQEIVDLLIDNIEEYVLPGYEFCPERITPHNPKDLLRNLKKFKTNALVLNLYHQKHKAL